MSGEFNGVLPAANQRQFKLGQRALTPLWMMGSSVSGLSGWQGEVIVGTVVGIDEGYDLAPDADIQFWLILTLEVTLTGEAKPRRLTRTNYNTIPLPA